MEHRTPEHIESTDRQDHAGSGSDGVAASERFTLSFQIPQLRFSQMRLNTLTKNLRGVAKQAMEQTGKKRCTNPIGLRIHVQYAQDEQAGSPPEMVQYMAQAFIDGMRGIVFNSPSNIVQLVVTKAWGQFDGVSITAWEVQ
jgi:hypothetical protein